VTGVTQWQKPDAAIASGVRCPVSPCMLWLMTLIV
jgi:hypothetical protein